ncbi:MAG: hypothetical protein O2954_05740 [bacterium]|nr:hypothetical protein [bacterium]
MDWIPLTIVCAHLIIGLVCGHLAQETRLKPESWFLAGALFGGFALIAIFIRTSGKRSTRTSRTPLARKA